MKRLVRTLFIGFVTLVSGYIVWGRVEAHRLASDIQAIAARGEPVDLSSLDAPLPSAAHVEAARLYADAAARALEIAQGDFRLTRLDVDTVVGSVNVRDLEATYLPDAAPLQLLDRVTPLPFAGFNDEFEASARGLQALGGLAALRADLLAYRGNGDAAAQALIAAVGLQRTLPESFFRYQLGARQLGSLRILLRHSAPSASALEALQRAFAALPDEDGLVRDLMLRRARLIQEGADGTVPGSGSEPVLMLFRPFLTRIVRLEIERFPEVIAAARQPWPDKFAALATLAADGPPRRGEPGLRGVFGPVMNVAALSASPGTAGLNLAVRRVAVATLAIERYRRTHGALPPSLAAVVPAFMPAVPVDPFTGQPIVFRTAAGAYLVYSADANRQDDGAAFYGIGSLNAMPLPRVRDFGIKVPLTPRPVAQ